MIRLLSSLGRLLFLCAAIAVRRATDFCAFIICRFSFAFVFLLALGLSLFAPAFSALPMAQRNYHVLRSALHLSTYTLIAFSVILAGYSQSLTLAFLALAAWVLGFRALDQLLHLHQTTER